MADETRKPIFELLYEAALQGDVSLLQNLLLKDPFLLHRPIPFPPNASPLHVACKLGHTRFTLELLNRSPNLVEELDPNDKSSLLHVAARDGHLELLKSLVSINPSLCYGRDIHGRTPVHVAVIKGQLHVLEGLLRSKPDAARERVGVLLNTMMHLCVKYNQLEALMLAVRMVGDTQMLNATDVDGNTILHLAVAEKRIEIVEFLLREKRLKKNTQNSNGMTAMDVLKESPRYPNNNVDDQLRLTLEREKVFPSSSIEKEREKDKHLNWLENQRSALMVVASLIATMAFQAGLNPPGGVWQDTSPILLMPQRNASVVPGPDSPDLHYAGTSIMAQERPYKYSRFLICNTIGFVLSMSSILLLISGLPCRRFSMALVMVTMWAAVSSTSFSYLISTFYLIPSGYFDTGVEYKVISMVAPSVLYVWYSVMGLLLVGNVVWWIIKFIKHLSK